MKTTNIILIGVVGVGAVGAYMYMKNKKAQSALLTGSLPATKNQVGGFAYAPTLSGAPTKSENTSNLSTTSDGVSPSDANINLANATVLVAERAILVAKTKAKFIRKPQTWTGGIVGGLSDSGFADWARGIQLAKKALVELDAKLAKLGYKVDATGALVRI